MDLIPVGKEEESINNVAGVLKVLQFSERSARYSLPVAMEALGGALRAWSLSQRVPGWWDV